MEHIFPLLDSIDSLLADINKVRSSELSLKQLGALIDEEFEAESKHMVTAATTTRSSGDNNQSNKGNASNKSKQGSKPKIVTIIILKSFKWLSALLFSALFCLVFLPEKTELSITTICDYLSSNGQSIPEYNISNTHWYFRATQMARLGSTSLQLERKFPITEFDPSACLVYNPFFEEDSIDCLSCKDIKDFHSSSSIVDDFSIQIKMSDIRFSLARFQQVLKKNNILVNQHTALVKSSVDYVRVVEDLMDNRVLEQLEGDHLSHISITALSFMSSHILRKELPRPQEFNVEGFQMFMAFVFLDGENSPSFQLSKPPIKLTFMYIQCTGSRRLVFTPDARCSQTCHSLTRVMRAGDIAFFGTFWTVHSEPTNERSLAVIDVLE